ncbi:AAA domain-containing protein [Burkholderia catarinensis]|uniref:AAA domain-containing protein n=1 Tax=Burkholderia catarinensis TaxID=1108140 RepID=UPI00092218D6|nr:AAA domain-containing protein [Burkholderia catarinensis]
MPEIPVEALAQYWCSALDYVSFDDLRDRLRKSGKLPELTLLAADAHRHGASPDAEGQTSTGNNVQVVLALWEADANHVPQLKNRMHMLLAVPAILTEDNLLAPRTDAPPIFNGKYLDPDVESYGFRIAHRDEANAAMTQQLSAMVTDPTVAPGWDTWWRTSMAVLRGLLGVDDDVALLTELIARLPRDRKTSTRRGSGQRRSWQLYAVTLPAEGSGRGQLNATYAAALTELQRENGRLPLFERLGGGENAAWIEQAPPSINQAMTGHIDEYDGGVARRGLFPLDATQRTAVGAILSLKEGELQAVNGPPGSGKTSMLRAVVASQWINAALQQAPCPITLACGATNQSVTNVIEAFGNAPHPDATLTHAQRWIADASSYGAYLPASSRLTDASTRAEAERFVCLQETKGGFLYRYWNRQDVLDPLRAIEYEEAYLIHARHALNDPELTTLEAAIEHVWHRLDLVMDAQASFEREWREGGPWHHRVERAFEAARDQWTEKRIEVLQDRIDRLNREHDAWAAEDIADLLWRADAFHWAARYWEGRFLLAQRERLVTRHPANVEDALRRLCMLTPCIVSTLHSAPRLFAIEPTLVNPASPVTHVLGKVDLLVVDEAGQAPPELTAAIFALARRAAVVGDRKQLAPIWNNTPLTEFGIAAQTDTLPYLDDIVRSHRSVASGSMLDIARLLSRWREADDLGVTLKYHYRCKPDIIRYCNTLAYGNRLKITTEEDDKGPEPTIAWVSVNAEPLPAGGSWRNPREVEEIVAWVVERWPAWQANAATAGKPLREIVALITPYRPQADLLKERIQQAFDDARESRAGTWPAPDDVAKVVVGTVHKLQGAERPIVCFSLVEGPEQGGGSFIDADASLLNVAVSRAKRSFIVFAHPTRLFSGNVDRFVPRNEIADREALVSMSPVEQLGVHLRHRTTARPLYPQRAVLIEAPNKQTSLGELLGKASGVIATAGALTTLPLEGGVDINAGFVPRPVPQDHAAAFVANATPLVESVDDIVIATDDDRMGEYIGWQILRLLREPLASKRVVRARLGAITHPAVEAALASPGALDENKVMAEIVREIADNLITARFHAVMQQPVADDACLAVCEELAPLGAVDLEHMPAARSIMIGRVQGAVLRMLLDTARQTRSMADSQRIVARLEVDGITLRGEVVQVQQNRATTPAADAPKVLRTLQTLRLMPDEPPVVTHETADLPAAGTILLMAQAWRRFGLLPWRTMDALQALYDGTWSNNGVTGRAFDPLEPIDPGSREGHPPVTPLDRSASPETLAGVFAHPDYRDVYTLVWEHFIAAEQGPYLVRHASLDLPFESARAAKVRLRIQATSCNSASGTVQDREVVPYVAELLLGEDAQINSVDALLDAWQANAFDTIVPQWSLEAATLWNMPVDRLLLDLEFAGIGRPSTLARSLQSLAERQLIKMPVAGGSVCLTVSGVQAALTLEERREELSADELSDPGFTAMLADRLDEIEHGQARPSDVLAWLGACFMSRKAMREIEPRIWNTLAELESAMRPPAITRPGALITPAANESRHAPGRKTDVEPGD